MNPPPSLPKTDDSTAPPSAGDGLTAKAKVRTLLPIFLAGLFMVMGILVLVWIGRDRDQLTGSPLIDIDLHPLLNTDSVLELDDLKGQIVLYHFWGPWCEDCIREYPKFANLAGRYSGKESEVTIVSVACSSGEENDTKKLRLDVEVFFQKLEATGKLEADLPIYCDPAIFTRANLVRSMPKGGFAYPTTILVDQSGIIRSIWRGDVNMMIVEREIEKFRSVVR